MVVRNSSTLWSVAAILRQNTVWEADSYLAGIVECVRVFIWKHRLLQHIWISLMKYFVY